MKGFDLSEVAGQKFLRFLCPNVPLQVDIRLFLRGPLLDGTHGKASCSRQRLEPVLGPEMPLIAPHQVHGVEILTSEDKNTLPTLPKADGILLSSKEIESSLRFADCAPVVIAPLSDENWVLLMHSGYKGTVQNIVSHGLGKVIASYGSISRLNLCAWIGPSIGKHNYPRDMDPWTELGMEKFHSENFSINGEKVYFDISAEIKCQLTEAGLQPEMIFSTEMDTLNSNAVCYSYRGGDVDDRMFLWARLL